MTTSFLPYALPDLGDEEIAEVADTLRSGWITTGPKTKRFESDFAAFLGGNIHAIAINSATSGLHLALEAVGITAGDEVIVPSLTFTATAEVVRYLGAHPVIVDVDKHSLTISIAAIKAAITPKTRAIIPVHYAGMACDMQPILALAKIHKLKVIEDAAHALPTTYQGALIGTLASDATVFSFYANKCVTTGEGGMLVTQHADIAERCKVMRLHGISRDAFDRFVSEKPSWHYEVIAPGFKYNMTDIAAAIGIHQLAKLPRFWQRRAQLAAAYDRGLANLPLLLPPRPQPNATGHIDQHAWHLYPIRLTQHSPLSRDELINALAQHGIGSSVHYIPLHEQPIWRDSYHLDAKDYPVAHQTYLQTLSLPLYTRMHDADLERVIATMRMLLCA